MREIEARGQGHSLWPPEGSQVRWIEARGLGTSLWPPECSQVRWIEGHPLCPSGGRIIDNRQIDNENLQIDDQ